MDRLDNDELERSAIVANCRMNRERNLKGSNGYDRELGLHPLDEVRRRSLGERPPAWLDLGCGAGRALVQVSEILGTEDPDIEFVGVDLVGRFDQVDSALKRPRLIEASLSDRRPDHRFDLITRVHGLHDVGDKLRLIARAVSWPTEDGLFVASLDVQNPRHGDGRPAGRRIAADLRWAGLEYGRGRKLVIRRNHKILDLPYLDLGADGQVGPNQTGQPVVDSYYDIQGAARR